MPNKSFDVEKIICWSPYLLWLLDNCGKLSCSRENPLSTRFPLNYLSVYLSGLLCPLIKSLVIIIIFNLHFNLLLSPKKLLFFKSLQIIEVEVQEICSVVLLALLGCVAMANLVHLNSRPAGKWDHELVRWDLWWLGCHPAAVAILTGITLRKQHSVGNSSWHFLSSRSLEISRILSALIAIVATEKCIVGCHGWLWLL